MGFCLLNHVAIAARALQAEAGLERILILDWDVHHGNGTQHIFEEDGDVFFASVHQWPLYPGTGAAQETGRGEGAGATLNCPLPPGAGDEAFLGALRDRVAPAADRFQPEFLLVSAGFDAHEDDLLGGMRVTAEGFAALTRAVREIADACCEGRIVSMLEGGYGLEGLAASTEAHLRVLFE